MSTDCPSRVTVHGDREVVVEFDPDRTFECVEGCTWCCHRGVALYDADFAELADRVDTDAATTAVGGEASVRREPKDRAEHVDIDGAACFFLGDDGLCGLEAEHDWKPTRCSVFPLAVSVEDGDIHVSIRDDARRNCEGLDVSERRLVDNLEAFLPELLWDVDDPDTDAD